MRIVRLQSENFKRLKAVDITPEGDLVEIRGMNGNGKSSVLDSIFAALDAAGAKVEMPVREGEEAAVIRLDLGEMVVTRYFTAAGTTGLKVTNAEGFSASSPQTMLDALVGHISFDPLAFRDLKPEQQAEELRKVVEIVDPETGEAIDLDAIKAEIDKLMTQRRDVNRDGNAAKARFDGMGGVRHVPEDAASRDELVAKMAGAAEHNSGIERERNKRSDIKRTAEIQLQSAEDERQRAKKLREEADNLDASAAAFLRQAETAIADLEGMPALPAPIDVAEISAKLAEVDNIEANRRHNAERDRIKGEYETLAARSRQLTEAMKTRHRARVTAISSAKMPVDGLTLEMVEDKLVVMFDGIPFSQASDADRLRVSAAVAMAANPKLRVLRLKDASLLDRNSIAVLRGMAQSEDFQIWAEFVGDEGTGIIMEEGVVRGAPEPEPLPMPKTRKPKAIDGVVELEAGEELKAGEAVILDGEGKARPAPKSEPTEQKPRASTQEHAKTDAERTTGSDLFAGDSTEPRKPRAMRSFSTKPQN